MIIGVDPGITGAIAFIHGGDVKLYDMPVMAKTSGKGNQVNSQEVARLINDVLTFQYPESGYPATAFIERVSAMPGQGVTSVFSFGKSAGILEGVLAAMGVPIHFPTPQKWKKHHGLIGKEKDYARTVATQLFPQVSGELARKKDIGRADALLIAAYGENVI